MQSELYSQSQAEKANLSLEDLGIDSWSKQDVVALQKKIGATADGWFGPKSIEAWKAWARKHQPNPISGGTASPGQIIIDGVGHNPPQGVLVVNYLEDRGIPAQKNDTGTRKYPVTQFVLHRGAEAHRKGENYAEATERVLDARGLSTTFSMDIDGTIYQHFDPAVRRGRHATYHNVQSDSLDIGGPFSQKRKGEPGQQKVTLQAAIGRVDDGKPPLTRGYGVVRCWSLTPSQVSSLVAFLPWYCHLRGIRARACKDWRTFRVGNLGIKDPVTRVTGILAHTQISNPGRRVDGLLPLHHLLEEGAAIEWREGPDFFSEDAS